METTQEIAQFAQTLAHEAGALLKQAYQNQGSTNIASRTSPKALHLVEDNTMDAYLVKQIQERFPKHAILIEESGKHGESQADVQWLVDPIDGSGNFANRNPFVAVSLAVLIKGELTIGVIEAPLLGEQFVAVKGRGAMVNGQPIHVSGTSELSKAYVLSCDGGAEDRTQVFSTLVRNYYDQVTDFRKLGSAALECAWVAAGRADAYITMDIDPWDVAAGVLLLTEAGGMVTTFEGQTWLPQRADLLVSNGKLHGALADRLWGY